MRLVTVKREKKLKVKAPKHPLENHGHYLARSLLIFAL